MLTEELFEKIGVKDLILNLFTNAPRQKNSVPIGLEKTISYAKNNEEKNQLIQLKENILMIIFVNGARILFGENVTPENITEKQYDVLNYYMESIGYTCKYNYIKNEDNTNKILSILFEAIEES